ncbi:MAG: hypothetical protein L3J63_09775 [Geopsychrobacter sp.]|nr:hypothetical protein [Geopsychrobacter sp.]
MKRFRFTFLAVCLLLTWLGGSDLILQLRNPEPLSLELSQIPEGPLAREWVTITGGHLDLLKGVNMSGTIEVDSFLIPLIIDHEDLQPRIWVETRNPSISNLLTTYYFKLENDQQRADYLKKNRSEFFPTFNVTGMTADSLIADLNHGKLVELLTNMGIETRDDILFISEGKEPNRLRGPVFLLLAIIGVFKFIRWSKKPKS